MENELLVSQSNVSTAAKSGSSKDESGRLPEDRYFRELRDAILAGQKERFEEIVDLFRQRVYNIAWRTCQNQDDAFDVSQEVFLRAYNALKSWHGRARFSTWLHRIAINASIDFIRRQSKHRNHTESVDEMAPERVAAIEARRTPHDEPRRQAYTKELRAEIYAAVRKLPVQQQRCFVLRHYHECPLREIASILHISEGAVKRHLHRAARRLRTELAARLGNGEG